MRYKYLRTFILLQRRNNKHTNVMALKFPEIKISVKIKGAKFSELHTVSNSKEAYEACMEIFNKDTIQYTEEVLLLFISRAGKLLGFSKISSGGTSHVIIDSKVIFTLALNSCAQSIIVAHNHPSGNLTPSRADIAITEKLCKQGEIMDIKILDHIICSNEGYYSFLESGKIK